MAKQTNLPELPGLDLGLLSIHEDDTLTRKVLMLIEGVYGIGVGESIKKYGFTEQRYYQLLRLFKQSGISGLIEQKRGPKQNTVRTDQVNQQIIRYRFLDPDSSPKVIAQKLNQLGYKVSLRSVERAIATYGLQKKTSLS